MTCYESIGVGAVPLPRARRARPPWCEEKPTKLVCVGHVVMCFLTTERSNKPRYRIGMDILKIYDA
jgi:hypothetical protein